jgi:hypothetical protein
MTGLPDFTGDEGIEEMVEKTRRATKAMLEKIAGVLSTASGFQWSTDTDGIMHILWRYEGQRKIVVFGFIIQRHGIPEMDCLPDVHVKCPDRPSVGETLPCEVSPFKKGE